MSVLTVCLVQRAHIPKAVLSIIEKAPGEEIAAFEKAKKEEEDRLAAQEKIYQVSDSFNDQ